MPFIHLWNYCENATEFDLAMIQTQQAVQFNKYFTHKFPLIGAPHCFKFKNIWQLLPSTLMQNFLCISGPIRK